MVVIECDGFLRWCHLVDQDYCIFFAPLIFVFGGPRMTSPPEPQEFPVLEVL